MNDLVNHLTKAGAFSNSTLFLDMGTGSNMMALLHIALATNARAIGIEHDYNMLYQVAHIYLKVAEKCLHPEPLLLYKVGLFQADLNDLRSLLGLQCCTALTTLSSHVKRPN